MTAPVTMAATAAAPAALALLLAAPAAAEEDLGALRLATCAALWDAQAAAFGDEDGGERALARRFEAAAAARVGADRAAALAAERRPWMLDLLAAYVLAQDDQSRDLYERLLRDCADLQADLS